MERRGRKAAGGSREPAKRRCRRLTKDTVMRARQTDRRQRWNELTLLIDRLDRGGLRSLSVEEVKDLCRLYRQVTVDLSQARTSGDNPELIAYLNALAARAHGQIYGAQRVDIRPVFGFVLTGFPRLVRKHARPVLFSTAVFLFSTLASWLAVIRSPELAYSLFDENLVAFENLRLEKHQGEYKGNFAFTASESPLFAVLIMGNNILVSIRAFGLGALGCVPGLYIMSYNGRMLGTLTGLMWNHGYTLDFYSLILTHGVLELTAICISGGSGLLLGWALLAPGRLPRKDALKLAAKEAFGLLAGCCLLLVLAGLIEAYITPHFSPPVRWSVAGLSALFLVVYFGFAGRGTSPEAAV